MFVRRSDRMRWRAARVMTPYHFAEDGWQAERIGNDKAANRRNVDSRGRRDYGLADVAAE